MAVQIAIAAASFAISAINGARSASKARRAAERNLQQLRLSAASKLADTQTQLANLRGDLAIELNQKLGEAEARTAALGFSGKTADRIKSNISALSQKKSSKLRSEGDSTLFNIARNFSSNANIQKANFDQIVEGVTRNVIQSGVNLAGKIATQKQKKRDFNQSRESLQILSNQGS